MTNPFRQAEAWEPQLDQMMPEGNHVATIEEAQDGTSSGNYPQIELRLVNDKGAIRDWLVITQVSIGKIVALATAAGVELPEDSDIADIASLRLKQSYIDKLVGKKVGVVIRSEPDYKDPTKTRLRVQGYVDPSRIADAPSDIPNGAAAFQQQASKPTSDLPF